MVFVGLREWTRMVEHSWRSKLAAAGPERTKGSCSYGKMGRVAIRGWGPCNRNCHHGGKNVATAKHHQGGRRGEVGKLPNFSFLPPSTSLLEPAISKPVWKPEGKGPSGYSL